MAGPPANTPLLVQLQLLLVNGGLHFVEATIIVVVGWTLATWVKRWLEAGLAHIPMELTFKPLIAGLARYAVLIVTLLLVLGQFGFQTTSLIALLGAAGLAIGLAVQGTLSNVAAGMMLLILRPFRVGQYVSAGGQEGTVREIGLFTTIFVTRDNLYVSIPNSSVFSGVTINYTRERTRRIHFNIPVDRASDLDLVEKTIVDVLRAHPLVQTEPTAPSAIVAEIQEYAVIMTARAMVRSADYWNALYPLRKDVKTALDKAEILYPVTRQASVIRNEPQSAITAPKLAPTEDATQAAAPNGQLKTGMP